jgi:hypothetical protein
MENPAGGRDRTAVLVIRILNVEPPRERFRARVSCTVDIQAGPPTALVVRSPDELVLMVEDWLSTVLEDPPIRSDQ